jgi:fatty-acyl-CoA synthase
VKNPERTLATVIAERAAQTAEAPALLSDRECLTYGELAGRANQYARWALQQGIGKGEVVCLLMSNRPEYFAIWLGITSVGGVVALLNTNLGGASLALCIRIAGAAHLIVESELVEQLTTALPSLGELPEMWTHGCEREGFRRIDVSASLLSTEMLGEAERRAPSIQDRALYIYTSGTTGMPKAANVSHARVMQWCHWFAGMMDAQASDRMYNCLPMYHSVGGVLATGAILVGGGAVVIRERFSASQFWSDVNRWDCTLFQYIGEMCRYLLHVNASPQERSHRIRMACGNGLAAGVWEEFERRFSIPQIFEFYAATEGGIALFNAQGKRGAIGHVPAYLAHRFSPVVIRFDVEKGVPARNEEGWCVRCAANETGEVIGRVVEDAGNVGSRFEGYTDEKATDDRYLRDVFELGDKWVRTGDLMRRDAQGFFYFVDRVGDTFRWKGENVATSEVAAVMAAFPGVQHANVYGVKVPASEGRAGMAALVAEPELDLQGLRRHVARELPVYARPLFLRIQAQSDVTTTFKYAKGELVRQAYDPSASGDDLYFNDAAAETFVRLNIELFEDIQAGRIRL